MVGRAVDGYHFSLARYLDPPDAITKSLSLQMRSESLEETATMSICTAGTQQLVRRG